MTARLQLRQVDDSGRELPLDVARAGDVTAAKPWRTFRSHRTQRHYSGWYWSSTTGDHVIYESRLELARLLLADADPDIVGICAQPFLLIEGAETKPRRHIPDFFLVHRGGHCTVVNVKPADKLDDPKIAATLAWAGEVITAKGWAAEVWSGCDPLLMANVRFLAGFRRSWLFASEEVKTAEAAITEGGTIGGVEGRLRASGVADPRPIVLHLLWTGCARADLSEPLGADTTITAAT
ncbi:MAG: hypothetical protein DLM58_12270 [Pseudonocardiales bacterium]|nr:MAG: hypothetical protein DLM58_12270 [Pseudonocardiales bacterium]